MQELGGSAPHVPCTARVPTIGYNLRVHSEWLQDQRSRRSSLQPGHHAIDARRATRVLQCMYLHLATCFAFKHVCASRIVCVCVCVLILAVALRRRMPTTRKRNFDRVSDFLPTPFVGLTVRASSRLFIISEMARAARLRRCATHDAIYYYPCMRSSLLPFGGGGRYTRGY